MHHGQSGRRVAARPRALTLLIASLAALVLLSCSDGHDLATDARGPAAPPTIAAGTPAAPPMASQGIDFSAVVKRVRLRFRPDGDGWRGGPSSYSTRVGADGVRFAPRQSARTGAELLLGPSAVTRGDAARPPQPAPIAERDSGLAVDRGLATELYANTEEGLEESFRFEARPAGGSDVTVRIPVSGLRYNGATAKGLHFVDDATRLGVRYGVATWVDAAGGRTQVAERYDAGAIVLTVPAALVDGSAYPAVLDPNIGPEIGTDTPIFTNSNGSQSVQAASYGGGQHLVVWNDSPPQGGAQAALWAARVSAAGVVLDPYGIYLAYGGGGPAVAYDGTNWLVAWVQSSATVGSIYGTLVSAAGVAQNPGGVQLAATAPSSLSSLALSYGGGSYLLSYSDSAYDVRGQMVTTTGAPSGSPFVISGVFTSGSYYPVVAAAFNGTNHLVVYGEPYTNSAIYAHEVTTGGMLASGDILVVPSGQFYNDLSVAADSTDWMIAYVQNSGSSYYVKVARVTAAGGAPDEAVSGVYVNTTAGNVNGVGIVWDGTDYAVFWDRSVSGTDDVYAARVTAAGSLALQSGSLVNEIGSHFSPVVSFDTVNNYYLCAFDDNRLSTTDNGQDIRFNRFSTTFVKQESPSVLLTKGANDQQRPDAAWNGTDWLVVWEDSSGTVPAIWGTRVDPTGTVLDTNGIQIETQGSTAENARVTSDGTNWLVVWANTSIFPYTLYGARVAPAGTVVDTTPITVATGAYYTPALAYGSSTYAISYYSQTNGYVMLQRLSTAGVGLGSMQIGVTNTYLATVAFNGTNFLVEYAGGGTPVYAKRVTPAGTILDTTPLTISFSTAVTNLAVTAMGGQWLAGWVESTDVHASRISSAGTVLDQGGFVVASATGNQVLFDANNDGTNYWLVWTDNRTNGYSYDVYGGRVSSAGAPLDGSGFPIVLNASAPGLQFPSLGGGPAGELLVTYAREAVSPSEDALRVFGRIVGGTGSGTNGTTCTTAGQCASGFCVDGICCNTACAGLCQACTAALKGSGADGTCAGIASGTDPQNECAQQASTTCGTNGFCNGSGACAFWPSGTSCGAGMCNGTIATPRICDGSGNCTNGTGVSCSPYECSGGACTNPCVSSADCIPGDTCTAGACASSLLGNGAACTMASQCSSGFCADGVCCGSACTALCTACTAAKKGSGANGVCGPVAAGTDPDNECVQSAPSTCGQNGQCDGNGACQLWAQGGSCGASSCQGNVVVGHVCNGSGTCTVPAGGQDCTPYACAAGACSNPCATNADCVNGYFCSGGICKQPGAPGTPCTMATECGSGFCVDDVCCDSACTASCQACSGAAKGQGVDGACGPVVSGTSCAPGSCTGAMGTAASQCDGNGTCAAGATAACNTGYVCAGNACATSCTEDTSCAAGYHCVGGMCVEPSDGGSDAGTGGAGGGAGAGGRAGAGGGAGRGGGSASSSSGSVLTASITKSGCGCRTVGGGDAPDLGSAVVLAGIALGAARRRRADRRGCRPAGTRSATSTQR